MKPQCAPSQSPENGSKCFRRKKFTPPGAAGPATRLSIADFPNTFDPDSRTREMLFLIPDCVARPMPDSRSPTMFFSFPDHAKSTILDWRPSPMSFSIPDSAGAPFPDIVLVDRARKSPSS